MIGDWKTGTPPAPAPSWSAALWSRTGTGQRSTLGARLDARAKRQASARERRAWDEYLDKLDELHALRAALQSAGGQRAQATTRPNAHPARPAARHRVGQPV